MMLSRTASILCRSSARWTVPQARPFAAVTTALIKDLRQSTGAPISDCKKALEAEDGDMKKAAEWLRKKGAAKATEKAGRTANEGLIAVVCGEYDAAIVEVNSETDFVARNESFQEFVSKVAETASRVPPPPDSGVHEVTMEPLLGLPLGSDENALSVSDSLSEIVSKIRENITVSKAARVSAMPGVVGSYVHGSVNPAFPNLGTSGAVVAIKAEQELSEEAKSTLQPLARRLAMHVVAAKPSFLDRESVPADVLSDERRILKEQAASTNKPEHVIEKMVEGRLKKFYAEKTLLEQPHMVEEGNPLVCDVLKKASTDLGVPLRVSGFTLFRCGA